MSSLKFMIGLIYLAILSGCAPTAIQASEDSSSRVIRVTTTTGMIGDIAQNVGGERVEVTTLMGPGVDPHLYKASEGDLRALEGADIIFYNGLHLEAGMSIVLERMAERQPVFAVTDDIPREMLLSPPEFSGAYDPHVWFDVRMWMRAVETIRDRLIELDPASAAVYTQNASQYLDQLSQLHAYVTAQAEKVPLETRVLITAHDAFNYFGLAYGFEVRGLQGISTEAEASTRDVQSLAEFIVARKIPAVFVETSVSPRTVQAVQAAVQSRGWDVAIGGSLFSDAMGDRGTEEGTYIGMVRHNIDTIVAALKTRP